MERSATHGRPKGQTPRGDHHGGPRTIRYRSASAFLADYYSFVSRGFLFLNTRHLVAEGTPVRVTLCWDERCLRLTVRGRVAKVHPFGNLTNDTPGMLIELVEADPNTLHQLDELASSLRASRHGETPSVRLFGSAPM